MTSAACCAGNLYEGTPRGREETLRGFSSYVTEPPGNIPAKGIIVIIPDAFGWTFKNTRILADTYAERVGARCLLPDFMDGKPADLSALGHMNTVTDANASYLKRTRCEEAPISPLALLASAGVEDVSNAFSKVTHRDVVALSQGNETVNGKPLIDVGYTAHPSNLSLPTDIENVELPLAIDQGSADFVLNMAGVETIRGIFERKNKELEEGKERPRFEIMVVDGAKHGFAVRCDMDNSEEAAQEQIAETHAVDWFAKWFARTGSTT
ncbi:MAG: hypothetical protein Q9173_001265 [Seirophora scorigena]